MSHNPCIGQCVVSMANGRIVVLRECQIRQSNVTVDIKSSQHAHLTEGIAIGFDESLFSYFIQVTHPCGTGATLLLSPSDVLFRENTIARIVQHSKPELRNKWVIVLTLLEANQYLARLGDGTQILIAPSDLRL
eukprot:c13713_g1_i2.p2 GENE.c13713_g1_i2~~c13713_g1_i2.p2  ORF type:complete len:134 (+),score=25.14 c13713_g1_i2:786-1187(+)